MTKWTGTLSTRVISKKNSKQIIRVGRFPKLISSKAFQAFEKAAVEELAPLKPAEPFTFPYTLVLTLHLKGRIDIDTCNAATSVNDILMAAGIIADDKMCMRLVADKKPGAADFFTEIEIVEREE